MAANEYSTPVRMKSLCARFWRETRVSSFCPKKNKKKKLQSFEKKIVKRERDLFLLRLVVVIIMPLLSHLRQQTSSECASSTSFVVSKKKKKNGGGRNGKGTEGVLMRVFGAFEKKKKKKLTRGFLGKRYGRYDDDDGIHNGVYVARMMMGRGRGHLHVVRAKQTTELERDRLDIEISSTWDESMEDDFEFDEDGQLLDRVRGGNRYDGSEEGNSWRFLFLDSSAERRLLGGD